MTKQMMITAWVMLTGAALAAFLLTEEAYAFCAGRTGRGRTGDSSPDRARKERTNAERHHQEPHSVCARTRHGGRGARADRTAAS